MRFSPGDQVRTVRTDPPHHSRLPRYARGARGTVVEPQGLHPLADLRAQADELTGDERRLLLFRDFDPLAGPDDVDVPDPYYGGDEGFEDVLGMVRRTSARIVEELTATVGPAR